jgi:hypothetical protein
MTDSEKKLLIALILMVNQYLVARCLPENMQLRRLRASA